MSVDIPSSPSPVPGPPQTSSDRAPPSRLRPLPLLQSLRGVAALIVVVTHVIGTGVVFGFAAQGSDMPFGNFGVDIFFVISGFIIVYSSTPLYARPGASFSFLRRRIARIVPIYWIVISLYLLFLYVAGAISDVSPRYALSSYLFIPYPEPGGEADFPFYFVGWTLEFEVFFYFCFSFVLVFQRSLAVLAVSVMMFTMLALGGMGVLPPTLAFWSSSQLLEFVAGCLIAEAFLRGWRIPARWALLLAVVSIAWSVWSSYTLGGWPDYRGVVWGAPAAGLVIAATLHAPRRLNPVQSALARLGDASYSLYVVHLLVIDVATRIIQAVFRHWHLFPTAAYVVLMLALAIGVAFPFFHYVEKPLTRWLQGSAVPPRRTPSLRRRAVEDRA